MEPCDKMFPVDDDGRGEWKASSRQEKRMFWKLKFIRYSNHSLI